MGTDAIQDTLIKESRKTLTMIAENFLTRQIRVRTQPRHIHSYMKLALSLLCIVFSFYLYFRLHVFVWPVGAAYYWPFWVWDARESRRVREGGGTVGMRRGLFACLFIVFGSRLCRPPRTQTHKQARDPLWFMGLSPPAAS